MVNLGDEVKCKVTAMKGIVIGKTDFLYGCTRVGIQGKADKSGKAPEVYWCDEPQLDVVKKNVVKRSHNNTGGPMTSTPTRNASPKRN